MTFSESEQRVLYLYKYYSVRFKEHAGTSEKILKFKEGDPRAIDFFASEMISAMKVRYNGHLDELSNMLVCIIPSHVEGKYSEGLVQLCKRISAEFNMTYVPYLIKRTKTNKRKSQGGSRDIEDMLGSLGLGSGVDIKDKSIMILDDVTTTGNSIEAARKLLENAGARKVIAQTLGKSMFGTDKVDYIVDYPDFSVNIESECPKPLGTRDMNGAKEVLQTVFGYPSFKNGQEDIIRTILSGGDVLTVMPTGSGKSLCYQIPALLLDGITIVVSPLISLMQDQVKALNAAGVHAAYINSSLSDSQISAVFMHARRGEYKIIYVAPERLESSEFVQFAKETGISMVTVDEAHCISQWGQDFRPSYLKIISFIKQLSKRPVVGAFTATATEEVRDDIISTLNLIEPRVVVTGFNRENLYFSVETGVIKDDYVVEYIQNHPNDSGIIYCSTRKNVDELFEKLFKLGFSVTRYHAGMDKEERKRNQDDFIYDTISIIVATNAFGMGIDKSNVRYVIHYNMPQSMENYYQEAGRAGRDGLRSECILLYSPKDVITQKWLLDHKTFDDIEPEDIELIRERDVRRLHVMENYCKTTECLRNYILNYFGEKTSEACDNCGNCHRQYKQLDMTAEAKSVANCIYETKGKYGLTVVTGTLVGAKRARVREIGADKYKTYGILKDIGEPMVKRLITQMIQDEYLVQTDERYSVLEYGPQINRLRDPSTKVFVRYYDETADKQRKSRTKKRFKDELTSAGYDLFERLRALRLQIAKEEAMPPYIIFADRTLIQMCMLKPTSKTEMLRVSGVGAAKYQKYGDRFIDEIQAFVDENDKPTFLPDSINDEGLQSSQEETSKTNKKKEKTSGKAPFYLTEDEAEAFEYEEYLQVGVIRDRMNSIRESSACKVIRSKHIMQFLNDNDLVSEQFLNGVWTKVIGKRGIEEGIKLVNQKNLTGAEYPVLMISRRVQKLIVKSFTKISVLPPSENKGPVREGKTVTVLDLKTNEKNSFVIVSQSRKTHYLGYKFIEGHYVQRAERVLDKGGDGTTSISLQSPLGKALEGHSVGDTVSFKNPENDIEKFKIISIQDR